MKIELKKKYKSIKNLEAPNDLNNFMVLTGFNGSGKTHFLKALADKSFEISCNEKVMERIQYFDYMQFKLSSEKKVNEDIRLQEGSKIFNNMINLLNRFVNLKSYSTQIINSSRLKNTLECIKAVKTNINIIAHASENQENLDRYIRLFRNELKNQERHILQKSEIKPFLEIAKKLSTEESKKEWWNLTEDDILNNVAINSKENFLANGLSEIFAYYSKGRDDFSSQYDHENPQKTITAENKWFKFLESIGEEKFPWDEINTSLNTFNANCSKSSFPYKVECILDRNTKTYQAIIKKDNEIIDFVDLSSGEQVVLALMIFLYNAKKNNQFPELLLLDEIDATLHPDFINGLLKVLDDIHKQQQIEIILTTHNVSTIAYADETSIYTLEQDGNNHRLKKQDKTKAIQILSSGFLTFEEGLNLIKNDKPQIYCEGTTDIKYFKKVLNLFNINLNADFKDGNGNEAKKLQKLLDNLDKEGLLNLRFPFVFVFDCDVNKPEELQGSVLTISLNKDENNLIKKGVENLFSNATLEKVEEKLGSIFNETTCKGEIIEKKLHDNQKTNFCNWLCENGKEEDFEPFKIYLEKIRDIINHA